MRRSRYITSDPITREVCRRSIWNDSCPGGLSLTFPSKWLRASDGTQSPEVTGQVQVWSMTDSNRGYDRHGLQPFVHAAPTY